MLTFKDIKFKKHNLYPHFEKHGMVFFSNGYGVSVISGEDAYSDDSHPYELAVLAGSESHHGITYSTPITDDVVGYLDEDGVTEIMEKVQQFEPDQY